ncbi:hypothetical protein Ddye_008624 [Dipteronia dyeriana]|uniref:Uncharacterized protein n=1 Tax=Dipteronia dyeriana TaxID=168575 RepID=A0AAE0CLH8_9ROSI|nr:hypothetical protein Ddye_008624 [Dipteronia dyeriana]
MIYSLTGIDRSIYDTILYGVIKLRSHWLKYHVKRDNDIDFVFHDDSPIKEIYIDMEKRVGGDFDTVDEKPNEHYYPSSSGDTFVGVEQGIFYIIIG